MSTMNPQHRISGRCARWRTGTGAQGERTLRPRDLALVAAVALLSVPTEVAGQGRKLTISLALAEQLGGPAGSLEDAMRASGFEGTEPPGCFFIGCHGPIEYPYTQDEPFSALLGLRYAVHPRVSIEALATFSPWGETRGLGSLSVDHSVTSYAVVTSTTVRLTERPGRTAALRLGGGPAVYAVKTRYDSRSAFATEHRIGGLVETGFETSERSRVFLDLRAQWRYVGTSTIGPYEVRSLLEKTRTFPASEISLHHFFISAGIGLRL